MPGGGGGGGRVVIEAVPNKYFDISVREFSGDVAVQTAGAMIGQNERRRQRARMTGAE